MFSSPNNNGYSLFDPFNPNQTTMAVAAASFTTNVENPSSTHLSPFLPYSEAFLDNGNHSLMSQLLFRPQQDTLGSSCNIYSSSSAANNINVSTRKDAKKVTSNNSCDQNQKKKKKRSVGALDGDGATVKQAVPRRRTGKKDRHSKIYTAQGPRDRRMRLSLQIARKFFDLQDMLGFDKASKTIEWLFSKSKASIKELKESMAALSGGGGEQEKGNMEMNETLNSVAKRRPKYFEDSWKMKESRDKARERARKRTMMKKMKMRSSGLEVYGTCFDRQETNSNDLDQLGSSGTSQETWEDLGSCSQETRTPIGIVAEVEEEEEEEEEEQEQEQKEEEFSNVYMLEHQMDSVSIIEKFLGITSSSSSSSIFGYSNNIGDSSTGVNSEESYTDLSGNWNIRINDGAQSGYSTMRGNLKGTSTGNIFQVQNPNAVLACLDQNPHFSVPMAITSSTIRKPNPTASASVNLPSNEERKPSSTVSIYDYLSY